MISIARKIALTTGLALACATMPLTATSAATAPTPAAADPSPSSGQILCCNAVENANHLNQKTDNLLNLLGTDPTKLTGQVGVSCTAMSVLGLAGDSCTQQLVACSNDSYNGLIAVGCSPVNVGATSTSGRSRR